MSTPDLSSHFARIGRAEQQGSSLSDAIQSWPEQARVRGEAVIADDRLSWELKLRLEDPPPLDTEWNFAFGEAVHNLRSSLDNAVMTIAQHAGVADQKALKLLQFPSSPTSSDWKKDKSRIASLPAQYASAIEAVQPFQRGPVPANVAEDGLLLLREFDNKDKHYLQIQAVVQPLDLGHEGSVEFETEEGAAASVPPDIEIFSPAFQDGALLLLQRTKGRIARVGGGYKIAAQVQAVHPDGRQFGVTHILAGLCTYTRQVLAYVESAGQAPSPPATP